MSTCSQCGAPAEPCPHCGSTLCTRRLCAELHEAACAAVAALPATPITYSRPRPQRRERDAALERALAEQLVLTISHHRQAGRAALVAGDLDAAFDELWAARQLEPDVDRLGADARALLPTEWEIETDLTPLARALAAHRHSRAADTWRRVLDDGPARSIRAEAAEWLARDNLAHARPRVALRILHVASSLGRATPPEALHQMYRDAGLDPRTAFGLYLAACRLDSGTARAVVLRDPLTNTLWPDQDGRWWLRDPNPSPSRGAQQTDHQTEALGRARDLAITRRDLGWVLLAEGDHVAGPHGVRGLGRNVRAGSPDPADEDAFVRIRLAYEGAAERLPDVAWPWFRLAELLAWAGFGQRAAEHLREAERRTLGNHQEEAQRPTLRGLVEAGLGYGTTGLPVAARPFPAEPFNAPFAWRLRFR